MITTSATQLSPIVWLNTKEALLLHSLHGTTNKQTITCVRYAAGGTHPPPLILWFYLN